MSQNKTLVARPERFELPTLRLEVQELDPPLNKANDDSPGQILQSVIFSKLIVAECSREEGSEKHAKKKETDGFAPASFFYIMPETPRLNSGYPLHNCPIPKREL
jgi:hypothetical protein